MSFIKSKGFSVALVFLTSSFMILTYFIDVPGATQISSDLMVWASLIMAFSMPLGIVNMISRYGNKVYTKKRNYGFSIMLLVLLAMTLASGIILGDTSSIYTFFMESFVWPLGATMYSILAFYMMSANFVAMRMRNWKAILLVLAGIFVLLTTMPAGSSIPGLTVIGDWLKNIHSVSVTRGVVIGTAISTIALGVRTMLGFETSALGISRGRESKE